MKAVTGDDCEEAVCVSFCHLHFSCGPLLLSLLKVGLAFVIDEHYLSQSRVSYCHDSFGMLAIAIKFSIRLVLVARVMFFVLQ